MEEYIQITIIGVAIVFLALTMLFVIFKILGRLFSREDENKLKAVSMKPAQATGSRVIETKEGGEDQMIAVITAAVTAFMGHSNFKVRSVDPVTVSANSQWKRREPTVYWKVRRSKN
ncbi:MAG TPA: oxaloacetate decarboxylase subunit gamma [Mesotoga infera]|uniref:Oxaloacetate decarboxylase subunit gamma n=1 Tax=Mesotoga infera TaxID=1236046 RepID=A0A7C1CSS8_9BACT|nr:oxaloacetate decarboxylase subunit gamma [Mesotoga infera]